MKKNILIINAHWNNRGDEAAISAMLDELINLNICEITIQIKAKQVEQFRYADQVEVIPRYPHLYQIFEVLIAGLTRGRVYWSDGAKILINKLKDCDLVIHSPGGPAIGDIYALSELLHLSVYFLIMRMNKKVFFYAPSVGPFRRLLRNPVRKRIFSYAEKVILREEISKKFLDELMPNNAIVTLDAAFQNKICKEQNEDLYNSYEELREFLEQNKNVVGLTVTDLQWHPVYQKQKGIAEYITTEVKVIIEALSKMGYKVLMIPQLFGEADDYCYMKLFESNDCYVMSDKYSAYFQQFVIGKLFALIGMRYHSNIFSAKMCVPFISISYEQKMKGFTKKINYEKYCIELKNFSSGLVMNKFRELVSERQGIIDYLNSINENLRNVSHKTTEELIDIIKRENK